MRRRMSWRRDPKKYMFPGERRAFREGRLPTEEDIFCPFDQKDVDFTPKPDFDPATFYESQGYPAPRKTGTDDMYAEGRKPSVDDNFYYRDYEDKQSDRSQDPFHTLPEVPGMEDVIANYSGYRSNIKLATTKDGRNMYMTSLIIGIIVLAASLLVLASDVYLNVTSLQFIANASTAEGTVVRINRTRSARSLFSNYYVHYKFMTHDNEEFAGSQSITTAQLSKLNLSLLNLNGHGKVTVYYSREEPSKSMIASHEPGVRYAGELLTAVIGFALLMNGIIIWRGFKNGEYCIADVNGRRKIQKLK